MYRANRQRKRQLELPTHQVEEELNDRISRLQSNLELLSQLNDSFVDQSLIPKVMLPEIQSIKDEVRDTYQMLLSQGVLPLKILAQFGKTLLQSEMIQGQDIIEQAREKTRGKLGDPTIMIDLYDQDRKFMLDFKSRYINDDESDSWYTESFLRKHLQQESSSSQSLRRPDLSSGIQSSSIAELVGSSLQEWQSPQTSREYLDVQTERTESSQQQEEEEKKAPEQESVSQSQSLSSQPGTSQQYESEYHIDIPQLEQPRGARSHIQPKGELSDLQPSQYAHLSDPTQSSRLQQQEESKEEEPAVQPKKKVKSTSSQGSKYKINQPITTYLDTVVSVVQASDDIAQLADIKDIVVFYHALVQSIIKETAVLGQPQLDRLLLSNDYKLKLVGGVKWNGKSTTKIPRVIKQVLPSNLSEYSVILQRCDDIIKQIDYKLTMHAAEDE